MNQTQQEILLIKGLITELPEEQQLKIHSLADEYFKQMMEDPENSILAFTLATGKVAQEMEKP